MPARLARSPLQPGTVLAVNAPQYLALAPRVNRKFKFVSNDWGEYAPLLRCAQPLNDTCSLELNSDASSLPLSVGDLASAGTIDLLKEGAYASDTEDFANYVEVGAAPPPCRAPRA